jgi:hypothetical protein
MIDEIYFGGKQIARLFNVTQKTISVWGEKGFPKAAHGKYPVFACHDWWMAHNSDPSGDDIGEFRKRKLGAEARIKEYDAAVREGELVARSEAEGWVIGLVSMVKSGFLGLPRRAAPVVFGKEIREIEEVLNREIKAILKKLAKK